jgi:DNA-binding IclR family transcriptional regulator
VLKQPLRSFTDRTLTGPDWLQRELARTRARGFAVEDREFQADTRGVAVPVFGGDEAVAALGVVAPAERLPPDRQREIADIVGLAAAELSTRLVA